MQSSKQRTPVGRREFLRVGVVGALGLTLGDFLKMQAQADQKSYVSKEGSAKSDEKRKSRYKETDHVKAFYRVNRYPR